ncbi:MAG: CPBP family intramembrane metalloprotease [Actinobacteria bacterium]|nr:CPBP family intramembrane metalloprotease [Actinomycetota bacterium]
MTGDDAQPMSPRFGWGIPDAAVGFVIAYFLSGLTGVAWMAVGGGESESFGLAVATIVGLWVGFVGVPVLVARTKGSGSVVRDFGLRFQPRDLPLGLAAGVFSQFVLLRIVYLPFGDRVEELGRDSERLVDSTHGVALVVLVLLLAVGAPLVEELFFRGLLQRSLVRRLGPAFGITVSALVFGLTHFDPLGLLGLAAFGVVLGALVEWTGRLGPAVVAHVFFNATAVTVYLVR